MQSCNRGIVFVFMLLGACAADASEQSFATATAQNVGLPRDVAVPPKGVGVAPIDGHPGVVPASYPVASIGANNAPGSIALYGGQWVLPLPVQPGAKVLNASCDFLTTAGVVTTMGLVGRNGTITSKVVGPAGNVRTTVWLLPTDADPAGYTVEDGGTASIVLSFRDTSGAWTSGAAQQPVLGCAVNAAASRTLSIPLVSPFVTTSAAPASVPLASSASTAVIPFSLPVGSTITATRAVVRDNTVGPTRLKVGLLTVDGIGTGAASASNFGSPSAGNGAIQEVASTPGSDAVQSGRWYAVEIVYASGTASAAVFGAEVDYIP